MVFHYRILRKLFLCFLLTGCSYNPFTTNNHLTGSAESTAIGAAAGAGTAVLLGADKPMIALAGLGGATIGYYVSTLNFASGGVVKAGGQVYTMGEYVTIEIPTDSLFDTNSAELLPEAEPILDSAVAALGHFPNDNIMVSGNTSGFGTRKREELLSENRARQIAAYLWANGVNSFKSDGMRIRKLIYVGYSDYFPIANNIRASGIRANSRIQITGFPSKTELNLDKRHKVFANIGGMEETPQHQREATLNAGNAFKGDLLPDNAPAQSTDIAEAFNDHPVSETLPPQAARGYYQENTNQNNVASAFQTSPGKSVAKQGGWRGYKGEFG